jgi:hypothetical protein
MQTHLWRNLLTALLSKEVCMPILNVDLMTPKGVVMEGIDIPDHLPSEELIARLVNTLGLPRETVKGEPITYTLEIMNQGRTLQPGQTPSEAGAGNGDVIRLVPSLPIGGDEPKTVTGTKVEKEQVVVVALPDLLDLLEKNRDADMTKVADAISSASGAPQSFFGKYRTAMLVILLLVGSVFLFISPNKASQKENEENALQRSLDEEEVTPTPVVAPTPVPATPVAAASQPEMLPDTNSPAPGLHRARVNPRKPQPIPVAKEQPTGKKKCKRFLFFGCRENKNARKPAKDKKNKQEDSSKKAPGFVKSTVKSSTQSAIQGTINSSVHRVIR